MPIHNLGYRKWVGKRTAQASRWWTIAENGIRISAKSRWVKRMVMFAWLPVMYWGLGFFFVGQAMESQPRPSGQSVAQADFSMADIEGLSPEEAADAIEEAIRESIELQSAEKLPEFRRRQIARTLRGQFASMPGVKDLADSLGESEEVDARNKIWCWLLMTFFRYPQGIVILVMVGLISPTLIAQDIRSRAFLIYFSRPIGRFEYLAGKLFIPAAFIMFVTTLPAMFLYFFGIMMSPDTSVIWSTWDIPFRILAATFVLVVPITSLALMLSSLTQESRFATFAWFAIWTLGHGAWFAIVASQAIRMDRPPFHSQVLESDAVRQWGLLSLYNNLGNVQSWIFGFNSWQEALPGGLVLFCLTVFALIVLFRRVSAPIRV